MATTPRRNIRPRQPDPTADAPLPSSAPEKPKKRRGRFFLFLLFLVALLWFTPTILAKTPLLNYVLKTASKSYLHGAVSVQSASLGWLEPIQIEGILVADEGGGKVLEVASVTGDKDLWQFAADWNNLGHFRIEKPKVTLVLRPDGTNVEDLVVAQPETPAKTTTSTSALPAMDIEIVDGAIEIIDAFTKRAERIEKLNVHFVTVADPSQPMQIKLGADIPGETQLGKLAAEARIENGVSGNTKQVSEVGFESVGLPLGLIQPLLNRFASKTQLGGRLDAKAQVRWGKNRDIPVVQASVTTSIRDLQLLLPALEQDAMQMQQAKTEIQLELSDNVLEVQKGSFLCDAGNINVTGRLNLGNKEGLSWNVLVHQPFEIGGRIDLARFSALAPRTFKIRPQTQITAGEVLWLVSSKPATDATGGMKWQGQCAIANLSALNNNRPVTWMQPLNASFAAHENDKGFIVDQLNCKSEFLQIDGSGTSDDLTASASLKINPLVNQLSQFVDLGMYNFAGEGWGNLNWKRNAQKQFETDAEFQFNDLQAVFSEKTSLFEPNLKLSAKATGETDFSNRLKIATASAGLRAGEDFFGAELTQPLDNAFQSGTWPLHVVLDGLLQNWAARVQAFIPMAGWKFSGQTRADVNVVYSPDLIKIQEAKLSVEQLGVAADGIDIREPQIDLTAGGLWDARQRRLQIKPVQFVSNSISANIDDFVVALPEKGPMELAGTAQYQSDVGRIAAWFSDRSRPSNWKVAGRLDGSVDLKQSGDIVQCGAKSMLSDLIVSDGSTQPFQEPKLAIDVQGAYDGKTRLLKFDKMELGGSSTVAASCIAQIHLAEREPTAEIDGRMSYDLTRLCAMLRPYTGNKVRLNGRIQDGAFSWRGPLSLEKGTASATFRWDGGVIYGFDVGPTEIKPVLSNGVVQIEPMTLPVNGGQIVLNPKLRLSPSKEFSMPSGAFIRQVQITKEMCSVFMRYITPIVSGATSVNGSFSVDLDACRIPLSNPGQGDLKGKIIVHNIEIGPGPLIRELATVLGREKPAQLQRESVIPFQMVQSRVYQKGMDLVFPEFTIRTYGSVGVEDESLALMTEMPIPPKWLENNPLASSLQNQTIRLPINGTLMQPRLDQNEMQRSMQQFVRGAVQNAAENAVEKGLIQGMKKLDGLFPTK